MIKSRKDIGISQEVCIQISSLSKIIKPLKNYLSKSIKHINLLQARLEDFSSKSMGYQL